MLYVVWNENKTACFITAEKQLAYEVRKSSDANCYNSKGELDKTAVQFCRRWWEDNCTIEETKGEIVRIKIQEGKKLIATQSCREKSMIAMQFENFMYVQGAASLEYS